MNIYLKRQFYTFVVPCLVFTLMNLSVEAQGKVDEFLEAAKEFESQEDEAFELPDAVGNDLGDDALSFFFLSAIPDQREFYYLEGDAYRSIRAAYNSFGNIHKISSRARLELCRRDSRIVDGEERIVYEPLYSADLSNRSNLLAFFLPNSEPSPGETYSMQWIDFSEKTFPYGQLTFYNTLPKPLMVVIQDQQGLVTPGAFLRSTYLIRRKGVGYLKVALAVRDANGDAEILYNKRFAVYDGERMIAIPILDPWGSGKIKVLTYRDTGFERMN